MKRLLILGWMIAVACIAVAQSPKEELKKNLWLSASNLSAYPGPKQRTLTPAPRGKQAFYISHYGRHGSRHQTRVVDFEYVGSVLLRAEKNGKLSPLGREVMQRVHLMHEDCEHRIGELTELGARQHHDITTRMYERFPSVFQAGATIDARSTTSLRCVLSMHHALMQLMQLNPKLHFVEDATLADRYYLNPSDPTLASRAVSVENKECYKNYCDRHQCWERVVAQLFNDADYVSNHVNGERLNYYLFRLASGIQNTDLRKQLTLYDLFNDQEIYENWLRENVFWYLSYGTTPLNGGQQSYIARGLLKTMIAQADSCLHLPQPGAHLRYGHDTVLLPLVCLLGVNGYDLSITDLEQLEKSGWVNYRIYPMGCNLQFIFYRSSPEDNDILFKVLLNENEATLPIPTDVAPYYHWQDFREYYLKKISDYESSLGPSDE